MAKKVKTDEEIVDETPTAMKLQIVSFKVTGMSPLLQNNPAAFIGVTENTSLGTKKVYKDDEEAKLRLYVDSDGNYCHPCGAFTKAMVKAVAGRKFGKLFATNVLKGSVFITEPLAIVEDTAGGKPAKAYTIDRQPVVVGKARVLRCRPCFLKWQMRIAFEVDVAICHPSNVLEALSLAGRCIGIGDYRPEKGGGFGRFRCEQIK